MALTAACSTVDKELLAGQLEDPPAAWTAQSEFGAEPVRDWVAAFEDDALDALIEEAIAQNNDLLRFASDLDRANALAAAALGARLPTLNGSFNSSRSAIVANPAVAAQSGNAQGQADGDAASVEAGGGSTGRLYINDFSLGGQLGWEVDVWRRLRDSHKAAINDALAAEANYYGARLSIAGRVAQAWFSLIETRQQRELATRDVDARTSSLAVTERRYQRGLSSSLDLRLSRSALANSQAALAQAKQLESEAARLLEVLLGRYPAAEIEAAASLPALPSLEGAGAPSDLLVRRPDILAAEARMEAAGLRARVARKELLPQITLTTQVSTSGPNIADLIDPERLAGSIAAGLTQPIFAGGRLLANARGARASAQAAVFDYAQIVLTAFEEAETALAAEDFLADREAALKVAFEEAAAAEKLTERRYASGAASIFNLLDAQTRRISNESQYIAAQRQRVANRVQLYLAIGGDFRSETPVAALES
ncbi:MAG: efflux transporter outer membrane subunit [Pseudomonadota bacterium]